MQYETYVTNFRKRVLYYEIDEPNYFIRGLSNEIKMKISPTTPLDLALSYVSDSYRLYHYITTESTCWFQGVLEVVATQYVKEHGKVPVFFIDGIDLLAERDEKLCASVITLAMVLVNNNKLKIVIY